MEMNIIQRTGYETPDFSGQRTGKKTGENVKGERKGRKCGTEQKEGKSTPFTSKLP